MSTNKIIESSAEKNGLFSNIAVRLALLITIIVVFVPFSPVMPGAGLDPSWVFGMNQAVAQGLSFGKDIIFTFGPYASIYTKTYHPSTDFMMVSGSLYLALAYWVCCLIVMTKIQRRWILIFCAALAGVMYSRDVLLLSLPLLVGLAIFKINFLNDENLIGRKHIYFYVALLFSPLGLLPLIKGSILILCCAIAIFCSVFFVFKKQRISAAICILSPVFSLFFFWIVSGQSVIALPYYFINMVPIISGYIEAMAIDGDISEVISYLISSVFLLLMVLTQNKIDIISRIFLFLIYFLFLFISFKGGFIRHDAHAIIAGGSVLTASLLWPFVSSNNTHLPVVVIGLLSWCCIDGNYIKTSTGSLGVTIESTYVSAWNGLEERLGRKNKLISDYNIAVNSIRKQMVFPILEGTTDIYSYDQSYLIASGNSWSPRPILQSYSAYTPALAEINRKHLLGDQAPDNIIYRIEPIDDRIPSLEDGASWPALIANYRPVRLDNNFLFLRKKEGVSKIEPQLILANEKHVFEKNVDLPYSDQPIFAKFEIKPTILGRIANIFFKTSQLKIIVELKNGIKKQYRITANMAKSGFLISPLIENTAEFGMLYGKNGFLEKKLVKSITISRSDESEGLWQDEYAVTFSQNKNSSPSNISKLYGFDDVYDESSSFSGATTEKCVGYIDVVNDISPPPVKITASSLLRVNGWLVASADKTILPEDVYITLTDNQGNHKYLKTHQTNRPDVGVYFKKPMLSKSGYVTKADISDLNGSYILGLAFKVSGKMKICSQFEIPTTIVN